MTTTARRIRAEATHNLSGQRLGPKGQHTRERIVRAMLTLLRQQDDAPMTLSAVARQAGVRMSNLYLYFPDLGELLLAALHRVIDPEESDYVKCLRDYWPDAEIGERAQVLVAAHASFWRKHSRLLQMRNRFADAHDRRLLDYRKTATMPLIDLMAWQMGPQAAAPDPTRHDCATVLITGLERISTTVINPDFAQMARMSIEEDEQPYINRLIKAEARVIEFTIERMREEARKA